MSLKYFVLKYLIEFGQVHFGMISVSLRIPSWSIQYFDQNLYLLSIFWLNLEMFLFTSAKYRVYASGRRKCFLEQCSPIVTVLTKQREEHWEVAGSELWTRKIEQRWRDFWYGKHTSTDAGCCVRRVKKRFIHVWCKIMTKLLSTIKQFYKLHENSIYGMSKFRVIFYIRRNETN